MIASLFKRKPKAIAPSNPVLPEGMAVWAIGDIHGRLDLLIALMDAVLTDAAATDAARKVVIFLGDYVDRGPASSGVLSYLSALRANQSVEWRFLKGNHEETMLDFLEDPSVGLKWCEYGGAATLASYGIRIPDMKHRPEAWRHASADLNHKLPAADRRFLEALELSVEFGDYFFSHAGARPGEALDRQTPGDLMWIRSTFLDSDVAFERVIVHGHTPSSTVYSDHRRIGIDTRAYGSGVLTALTLRGAERGLIQTRGPGSTIGDESLGTVIEISKLDALQAQAR